MTKDHAKTQGGRDHPDVTAADIAHCRHGAAVAHAASPLLRRTGAELAAQGCGGGAGTKRRHPPNTGPHQGGLTHRASPRHAGRRCGMAPMRKPVRVLSQPQNGIRNRPFVWPLMQNCPAVRCCWSPARCAPAGPPRWQRRCCANKAPLRCWCWLSICSLGPYVFQNPAHRGDELLQGSGATKVPCLKITDSQGQAVWLQDSAAIVAYLHAHFGLQ